jgi:hypothetical protein
MGFYINPSNMSKEEWLLRNGTRCSSAEALSPPPGSIPICWVNNGGFTAAAIGYSRAEVERFQNDGTGRPQFWYLVPKSLLGEFIPDAAFEWGEEG